MTSAFSKRIGALVLSLALCLTMLPTGALAANDDTTEVSTSSSVTVGDFTVTGGVQGEDFSYDTESKQLTILSSIPLTISGEIQPDFEDPENMNNDTLIVPENVTAYVTLEGLHAFFIFDPIIRIDTGAKMYLTIAGSLDAGNDIMLQNDIPAIHNNGTLLIDGNGLLSVTSMFHEGGDSAAIGGAANESGGSITINGGIYRLDSGGERTIAFGAGRNGTGGSVTINGGLFEAGDYENHTVYNVPVAEEHYVSLEQVDSVTWYRVSDHAPSAFTVTGDEDSYTYEDGVLTLHNNAEISVSTNGQSRDRIVVDSGATVSLTLNGVELVTNNSPIVVSSGSNVTLTVNNENLVWSYSGNGAGIEVQGNLILQGNGKLSAIADQNSAGIGAKYGQSNPYHITIQSGNIEATAGSHGAGIGGAYAFDTNGSYVIINGGTVNAVGGTYGAGIGGGSLQDGGNIQINGGQVTARGGQGAGIGGGYYGGGGGNVIITGGVVNASGYSGIGNGSKPNYGEVGSSSFKADGDAVIFANSISDKSQEETWRGVIFQGNTGSVYGENITIKSDVIIPEDYKLTIPEDSTLTIPGGSSLTIGSGGSLTNNGTITAQQESALTNQGIFINNGSAPNEISGSGIQVNKTGTTVTIQQGDASVSVTLNGENDTVTPGPNGSVTIPSGFTINPVDGPSITVIAPSEGDNITVKPSGEITLPDGGQAVIKAKDGSKVTITAPTGGGTVTPGEDNTVTVSGGSIIQTDEGLEIAVGQGTTGAVGSDGSVTLPEGGTVQVGDTTITAPTGGGTVKPGEDNTVTVPGGSIVQTGEGPAITMGQGTAGSVGSNGSVALPADGTAQVGNTTITMPSTGGGTVKPNGNGTVTVPGGSTVQTGDGSKITVGQDTTGSTVGSDGSVTLPAGGTAQVGNTTITMPSTGGGTVTPDENGTVTVPGGSTVQTGDGPAITVSQDTSGSRVSSDGSVTFPEGGTATITGTDGNTTTVTMPNSGGAITPNTDGTVTLPGGSTVTNDGGEPTTVPSGGGILDPGTGSVTEISYTVSFNSQGGSAVPSQTVVSGGKVTVPTAPTRDGYTFVGWYQDAQGTVAWNFETPVTANLILYAQWSENSSGGGGSSGGSSSSNSGSVTGSGNNVNVDVSGSSVTTAQMETAVERADQGETITIDASRRSSVTLPSGGLEDAAGNENDLTVKLENGDVTLSPEALSAVTEQAGTTVTLTVVPVDTDELNSRQQEAAGDAPVFDLTLRSGSQYITDFDGGLVTVSLPYELPDGQEPDGVVVWYLDDQGNITPCETMYDVRTETVIFTTNHFSLYVIGYEKSVASDPFTDVSASDWFHDAVAYAYENSLMNGMGENEFRPNATTNRAMVVTILYRLAGSPDLSNENLGYPFADVDASSWYGDAVYWARLNGITDGISNTNFDPDGSITREQMAALLYRYANFAGYDVSTGGMSLSEYADVSEISSYAVTAMQWANENGLLTGRTATTLAPKGTATRAEIATILMRFCEDVAS